MMTEDWGVELVAWIWCMLGLLYDWRRVRAGNDGMIPLLRFLMTQNARLYEVGL